MQLSSTNKFFIKPLKAKQFKVPFSSSKPTESLHNMHLPNIITAAEGYHSHLPPRKARPRRPRSHTTNGNPPILRHLQRALSSGRAGFDPDATTKVHPPSLPGSEGARDGLDFGRRAADGRALPPLTAVPPKARDAVRRGRHRRQRERRAVSACSLGGDHAAFGGGCGRRSNGGQSQRGHTTGRGGMALRRVHSRGDLSGVEIRGRLAIGP